MSNQPCRERHNRHHATGRCGGVQRVGGSGDGGAGGAAGAREGERDGGGLVRGWDEEGVEDFAPARVVRLAVGIRNRLL